MARKSEAQKDASAPPDAAADSGVASHSNERRDPADATPSMAQYLEIKAANPDSILWYRMGDFYELFFEDAVVASQALSIVLTKRGRHLGQDIPMCGVPVHRADEYLQRLIRQGYRVAVCEQLEDPAEAKKRGYKAVVKRDVVRLVTPGTITEETLLDSREHNFLTALFAPNADGKTIAEQAAVVIASVDISTGEFEVGTVSGADLPGELVRLSPREIILTDALMGDAGLRKWFEIAGAKPTPVPQPFFDSLSGSRALKEQLNVAELDAFGSFDRPELAACGALIKYIDLTQLGRRPVLRPPRKIGIAEALLIDAASRSSLELVRSSSGEKSSTLLAAIDRTVTGPGARVLQAWLSGPLTDVAMIEARLDVVGYLFERTRLIEDLRAILQSAPDVARALPRLSFGRGGPRDLASVRDGLQAAAAVAAVLNAAGTTLGLPPQLQRIGERLSRVKAALATVLKEALIDDPPHLKRDGGFIRRGFSADLDGMIAMRDNSRAVMAALEARYVETTGVKTLKVRHNNILGFYVEVTQLNAKPLQAAPHDQVFRHRQSMANAMRFTTDELIEVEGKISSATDRALAIEQDLFAELTRQVLAEEQPLADASSALAELDGFLSLAAVAIEQNYVRPLIDESEAFEIRGGRHPVVEQALARHRSGAFIENDCVLGRSGGNGPPGFDELPNAMIWLVTGPNMAGKSTFLRQNALIVVLAQMGSFVPARSAHIGVVDRLFSRVGASDDLARGRSTFMVEMVETAAILNQATSRSLVILDEIGRGTATFDGLSIAWATVEYLHDKTQARSLFATHYHELTALARRLPAIGNVTMDISEWQDEIVFLHKVKAGAANRSYGIQVAKLAGLPAPVVGRAREVLALLEKGDRRSKSKNSASLDDLPLFASEAVFDKPQAVSEVENAIAAVRPDELSPKAALDKLYELKALVMRATKKDA